MRRAFTALSLLLAVTACTAADDKKDAKPEAAAKKKLGVGDPAPAITASKMLRGDAVTFEPGKAYVVEFWATWCGPCIAAMPHLNETALEYKEKGLTVVAVTTTDDNNSLEAVTKFVNGKAAKYAFRFAFCDTKATDDAWMKASEQDGIPCSFVVGKDGRIAFIGHPMELDDVLPKVVAGTWKGQADIDAIKVMNEAQEAVFETAFKAGESAAEKAKPDDKQKAYMDAISAAAPETLKKLVAFEAKYPEKAKQDGYITQKLGIVLQAKQYDDAKTTSEAILKKGIEKENANLLNTVRGLWASKLMNPERKHIALAVTATEALLKLDGAAEDIRTLVGAAEAYYAAGDAAKGKEYGDKAIKAAGDDSRTVGQIEKALKGYQEK